MVIVSALNSHARLRKKMRNMNTPRQKVLFMHAAPCDAANSRGNLLVAQLFLAECDCRLQMYGGDCAEDSDGALLLKRRCLIPSTSHGCNVETTRYQTPYVASKRLYM